MQDTTYRSAEFVGAIAARAAEPRADWATRAATMIAVVLAIVGAGAMLGGVVGLFGVSSLGGVKSMLFVGLGLIGAGAGALLLLTLHALRTES